MQEDEVGNTPYEVVEFDSEERPGDLAYGLRKKELKTNSPVDVYRHERTHLEVVRDAKVCQQGAHQRVTLSHILECWNVSSHSLATPTPVILESSTCSE